MMTSSVTTCSNPWMSARTKAAMYRSTHDRCSASEGSATCSCSTPAARIRARARCSELFTAATEVSRMSAASAAG
jgi:hypothetical protein